MADVLTLRWENFVPTESNSILTFDYERSALIEKF